MTWISVKERLPEISKTVLVWTLSGECFVGRMSWWWDMPRWVSYPGSSDLAYRVYPTHWTELPEGPEQGRK